MFAWLGRVVGGDVGGHTRLHGGITAAVDRVTVGGRDLVLKRWLDSAGQLVARESNALRALAGSGLPVPELLASDPTGQDAGVPCLAMSVVETVRRRLIGSREPIG